MATQFRQLGPADADLLTSYLLSWHRADAAALDSHALTVEVSGLLEDRLGWHAWLIQRGAEVVGYTALNFRRSGATQSPRAYVAALYLTPSHRQLQVGRQALRFLTDVGRWLQIPVFEFDTEREDKRLHLLGRSLPTRPSLPDPVYERIIA